MRERLTWHEIPRVSVRLKDQVITDELGSQGVLAVTLMLGSLGSYVNPSPGSFTFPT